MNNQSMGSLTGLLYGALIVYLGGWFLDKWGGNFSLLLFVLTLVSFAYWLAERLHFKPAREAAAHRLESQAQARRAELGRRGIDRVDGDVAAAMIPTLQVGDLILVNKYYYGIRLPVINKKVVANHEPRRGDVVVFRYPLNPGIDYIKRVVGVPGDEVAWLNQRLVINGQPVPVESRDEFFDDEIHRYAPQFAEKLDSAEHRILVDPNRPAFVRPMADFSAFRDRCRYSAEGVVCNVPPGHYFMMGDNRDNSQDSRFWGFVPDENIVGKAFFVWMNLGNLGRIGSFE
jgi:signal peptidase I